MARLVQKKQEIFVIDGKIVKARYVHTIPTEPYLRDKDDYEAREFTDDEFSFYVDRRDGSIYAVRK